jgi:hypothetical protein
MPGVVFWSNSFIAADDLSFDKVLANIKTNANVIKNQLFDESVGFTYVDSEGKLTINNLVPN